MNLCKDCRYCTLHPGGNGAWATCSSPRIPLNEHPVTGEKEPSYTLCYVIRTQVPGLCEEDGRFFEPKETTP